MSLKEIGEVTQRSECQVSRILTGTSPLTGERWIRKTKGRKRVDRLDNKELLNVMVADDPFVSTRVLANRLEEQLNVVVSNDTVCSRMGNIFGIQRRFLMSSPRNIRLTELDGVRCCWTELKTAPILFFICQLINQSMRGVPLVDLHSFLYRLYAVDKQKFKKFPLTVLS